MIHTPILLHGAVYEALFNVYICYGSAYACNVYTWYTQYTTHSSQYVECWLTPEYMNRKLMGTYKCIYVMDL